MAAAVVSIFGAASAFAQFVNSSTSALQVGNIPGDNEIPQILANTDGGCYILWRVWGNGSPGYATQLQRLDASGNELWPHNGVQIAPGSSTFTIVGGADLALCPDGSGVIVFVDTASDPTNAGVRQANVQKVSPSGALLWNGGTAVPVSTGPYGGAPGHVCAMPDGGCVVGYTVFPPSTVAASYIYFMRYTATGTVAPGWNPANPPYAFQAGVPLVLTCMQPGDPSPITGSSPGTFIASWIRSQNQAALVVEKYNGDGTPYTGWNPAITIDSHGLTQHDFPGFITDGNGGAIFGWHSYANSGSESPADAMLQHVFANGTLKFPTALPLVDPNYGDPSVARGDAALAYNPTDGSYFLAADQGPPDQPDTGSIVQKFDTNGNRLFTPYGFTLQSPAVNTQITTNWPSIVATSDGGCVVLGTATRGFSTINAVIYGTKVNLSGGFPYAVWNNYINSDATTGKGRMAIVKSATSDDALFTFGWPIGGSFGGVIAATKVSSATGAPGVAGVPPTITHDLPANVNACDGSTITLTLGVTGTPNMAYSWQRHYAYDVTTNPDAFWVLNDGDSAFGCIVPEDGTTYSGTSTSTLTISSVHALPATITCNSGTVNTDPLNNSYRCIVYNAASDEPTVSGTVLITVTPSACCVADFNHDGNVTVQDIFAFLTAWFAHSSSADVNGDGNVTVQDIFAFLTHWFAKC